MVTRCFPTQFITTRHFTGTLRTFLVTVTNLRMTTVLVRSFVANVTNRTLRYQISMGRGIIFVTFLFNSRSTIIKNVSSRLRRLDISRLGLQRIKGRHYVLGRPNRLSADRRSQSEIGHDFFTNTIGVTNLLPLRSRFSRDHRPFQLNMQRN